ncbi:MAG: HAD family hydrolase, partial [Candidatus Pacebacteria bacterium]|nr:HAD family hydrolase [Candidatus Paceibacterota bacterium]
MLYRDVEIKEVLRGLEVDVLKGLSDAEAQKRLAEYGKNEFAKKKKFSALKLFIKQFYDFLTLL